MVAQLLLRKGGAIRSLSIAGMILALLFVAFCLAACDPDVRKEPSNEKPVIYLYPEQASVIDVTLEVEGSLSCVYPAFASAQPTDTGGTWRVFAQPDGTLTDLSSGRELGYLFWEGDAGFSPDFSQGFCVSGDDMRAFLEDALSKLGLTDREAADFITYWLPRMQENPYNLVSFQGDAYARVACLGIDPEPDTVIRVQMAWRPLEVPVQIEPQELTAPARNGFTVVEWGGTQVE